MIERRDNAIVVVGNNEYIIEPESFRIIEEMSKRLEENFLALFNKKNTGFDSVESYRAAIEKSPNKKLKAIAKILREGSFYLTKNVESSIVDRIKSEGIKNFSETKIGVQAESSTTQDLIRTAEAKILGISQEGYNALPSEVKFNYFGVNNESQNNLLNYSGFPGFGNNIVFVKTDPGMVSRGFLTRMGKSFFEGANWDCVPVPMIYADVFALIIYDTLERLGKMNTGIFQRFDPDFSRIIRYMSSHYNKAKLPQLAPPFDKMRFTQFEYIERFNSPGFQEIPTDVVEVLVLGRVSPKNIVRVRRVIP
jgi:hypothetical protein